MYNVCNVSVCTMEGMGLSLIMRAEQISQTVCSLIEPRDRDANEEFDVLTVDCSKGGKFQVCPCGCGVDTSTVCDVTGGPAQFVGGKYLFCFWNNKRLHRFSFVDAHVCDYLYVLRCCMYCV